jgi:hypothetical protein
LLTARKPNAERRFWQELRAVDVERDRCAHPRVDVSVPAPEGKTAFVRFRQGVDLDPSQVEDVRGSGGFGGGLPIPGVAAGGGGLGVLLLVG